MASSAPGSLEDNSSARLTRMRRRSNEDDRYLRLVDEGDVAAEEEGSPPIAANSHLGALTHHGGDATGSDAGSSSGGAAAATTSAEGHSDDKGGAKEAREDSSSTGAVTKPKRVATKTAAVQAKKTAAGDGAPSSDAGVLRQALIGRTEASSSDSGALDPALWKSDDGSGDEGMPYDADNIYTMQNLPLFAGYFAVGIASCIMYIPVMYYLVDTLDASSRITTMYHVVVNIPWSLKVFIGLLSDTVPVRGYHRISYYYIGWLIYELATIVLAAVSSPGIDLLIGFSFITALGFLTSDVMLDTMVAERTKVEPLERRGTVLGASYVWRFFGAVIGTLVGAILYNKDSWGWGLTLSQLFLLSALLPAAIVSPFIRFMKEERRSYEEPALVRLEHHWQAVWALCQKRAVWRPMAFVIFYHLLYIPNGAWNNFLTDGLGFGDFALSMVSLSGHVFGWLGVLIYREKYMNSNWRNVFVCTTGLTFVFTMMQIALILGWNSVIYMPDVLFAVGDTAAIHLVIALQTIPAAQMFATMCPDGSEGTSYALLTTMSNIAANCAYSIGALLTGIWNVSNSQLEDGDYSGVWKLTVLTSCLQIFGVVLIDLLPRNKEEQLIMQASTTSSLWGGSMLLSVCMGLMLFTFVGVIVLVFA